MQIGPRNIRYFVRFTLSLTLLAVTGIYTADAAPAVNSKPGSARSEERIEDVLRKAREANGISKTESNTQFVLAGSAYRLGINSTYSLRFTPEGRFVESTDGPLKETTAFDGRKSWATDSSSMPRTLELGDDELANLPIWIVTGRWLTSGNPFEITQKASSSSNADLVLSLKLKHGKLASELTISRSTWLPTTLKYRTSTGEEKWTFSDYRNEKGIAIPGSISHQAGPIVDTVKIESVRTAEDASDDAFKMPKAIPPDTTFDANKPARIESIKARSGHTLIHPLINGKDVGWFFLDTGAEAMCITPEAAEAAGMPALGKVMVSGIGGSTTGRFRKGDRFELGPMTITGLTYVELDLKFLAFAFKQKIAGICGYDIMARSVIALHPKTANVDIYNPARYRLDEGRWRELFLHERNASVRCSFEGNRSEIFRLDTGAGDTVAFHAPAVRRLNLLEGRDTRASQNGGVGGAVAAREGKLQWFEIGGFKFEQPTVSFSLAATGAFSDEYTAGNVGQAFLQPFTVYFDYSHKRIAFVKEKEEKRTATQ